MANTLAPKQAVTKRGNLLGRLGVRPREVPLVALLFSNMFLSGIAIGMIRVCAFTLFLEYFASEQLALTAILIAVVGTMVTLAIERGTQGFAADRYIYTILATILFTLIVTWGSLGLTEGKWFIFALPLLFEVLYMLFSLQFIALLTRLLNVRQTKRLSGLARSGEFLAEMVGGLSIFLLLGFMDVQDLLLVAAVAVLGVVFVVRRTVTLFARHLSKVEDGGAQESQGKLLSMLGLPYVKLIGLCYGAFIFAYFFLDVAFYKYAAEHFSDERELAGFIGQFFAVSGFLTLLTMVFVFAPFLRRLGVLAGVVAFPVIIGIGSTAVSALEFSGVDITIIFFVMVATNGMRVILQSAIWRPTVGILFQVLPDRQRSLGTSLIEGIIDPLASGLAGVTLYIISEYLAWPPKLFLLSLAALMVMWIVCGYFIRRSYLNSLTMSIQGRKLGKLDINKLDGDSLKIILKGLDSPYPAEVFYCLNILEEIEHPDITNYMQYIMASKNEAVRLDILTRVQRLKLRRLAPQISQRIDNEFNPHVLGEVLKTYASLDQDDTVERLKPFIEHEHPQVRKGALIGTLSYSPKLQSALDVLQASILSGDPTERVFGAEVIGALQSAEFGIYLATLLEDRDSTVVDQAIVASGAIKDARLVPRLIQKLEDTRYIGRTGTALQQLGPLTLLDIERTLTNGDIGRVVKRKCIEVLQDIKDEQTENILLQHIDIADPELRHHIYMGLANLQYQASDDDRYKFVNTLTEEVEAVTYLLSCMEDIWEVEDLEELHSALCHELDLHRDNIMLLTSFIFSSSVMLDTRANIDSKVAELRVFALEVLDNLLTAEVKQIVFPLLDDLTVSERLQALSVRFPQPTMAKDARLNHILENFYHQSLYWTRSMLMYKVGELKLSNFEPLVREALNDPEPLVRETAIWALTKLSPGDLNRTLGAHIQDPNQQVRHIVSQLLGVDPAPVH